VMGAQEVLQRLAATESDLAAAIDSLAHVGFSDGIWQERLRKAAATVQSIQFDGSIKTERNRVEQLLRTLTERARTAGTLLDTAAALYFGSILSSCSTECGYLADGGANEVHYRCLRIDG
jgi:hypothetical protein